MTFRNQDKDAGEPLRETSEALRSSRSDGHPRHAWMQLVPAFCAAHGLSGRECEVLVGLLRREKNTAIARRLGISVQTVRFHLKSTYRKLGANDRVDVLTAVFEFCWRHGKSDTYLER